MSHKTTEPRSGSWFWPFSLGPAKSRESGCSNGWKGSLAPSKAKDKRYCRLLAPAQQTGVVAGDNQVKLAGAWKTLEEEMAFVPGGTCALLVQDPPSFDQPMAVGPRHFQRVQVASFYMDRFTVTNRDYARFVAEGGYRQMELWPASILSQVLQFVDSTGNPGPRHWSQGRPPQKKLDHPVTGISWCEASVYAAWVGKRLPTSAEWQRAGTWAAGDAHSGVENRYPWGNAFDPQRTNTWVGGPGDTVSVDAYYEGCTPNGIYQLAGNVWEWVATQFDGGGGAANVQYLFEQTMAEIRGGAFNTYFDTQATCQFRSGLPLLSRVPNVGFRCCISADQLCQSPNPRAFLEDEQRS